MSVIMNYYNHIDKEQIQFDFLYWSEEGLTYKDEILSLGGKLYKIPKPSLNPSTLRTLDNFFKTTGCNYEIIHLHELYLNSFIWIMSKKYNIPNVIAHAHTTKYSDKKLSAIRNRIMCIPLKLFTTDYVACSKKAGEFWFGKNAVRTGKVKIIYNAIEIDKFKFNPKIRKTLRNELKIKKDEFVVGHVGRFSEAKNHIFLIHVFKEITKCHPNSKLVLVGDGTLLEEIIKEVLKLQLQNKVVFLGRRTDIYNIYNMFDAFVLPSLFEGLGNVLIEAQVNRLSCIASSMIPKETKISNAITYLSLKISSKLWAKEILYKQSKRINIRYNSNINKFNIVKASKNLEVLYQRILKRPPQ
ncbi:MAG: hypothetical protein ATN32_05390 [Candidatus Epulonipiscium fishelsonii]|nr:MAG: hypothetical protein ATN32_05390 [Epulopiscium sp. AS2M-Bin002]